MSVTVRNRGKIVGEMLAQANLRSIMDTSTIVSHQAQISFSHDPAAPFSETIQVDPVGYRCRALDEHGHVNEVWYHDQAFEKPAGVRIVIIHDGGRASIEIKCPAGKLELFVERLNGTMRFAGTSVLDDIHGEFSGCVHSRSRKGISEYLLEYSDIEVNTFSETLTVDDFSGAILSVDSAEADQDDGPEGRPDAGRVKNDPDKYDVSFDEEQVGP